MVDDLDLGLIISTSAGSIISANNLLGLSAFLCRPSYCLNCDSFISSFFFQLLYVCVSFTYSAGGVLLYTVNRNSDSRHSALGMTLKFHLKHDVWEQYLSLR